MRLILGSASPRRRELLAQIGIVPDEIRAADINEDPHPGELPRPYCRRITQEKALALDIGDSDVLLTADTTVAVGRRILGKPADASECEAFLRLLSGRRHKVITAICVRTVNQIRTRDVVSTVQLKRLSDQEIAAYLKTGDWQGKAGGYAIQGPAGALIPWISGSYPAIMGLPLAETANLLSAAGYDVAGLA
ncbi:MAG: septum formation protein Maf [Rhodobacteraceae bacterium]|nr:septum formation protein Maf [Paracoccaceae bacterium]